MTEPTNEMLQEAVDMIPQIKNLDEWRDVAFSDEGPLHGCEIPLEVEQVIVNGIYDYHQDATQLAKDTFNLRQRMN